MNNADLARLKATTLIAKLPDLFGRNETVPQGLFGATIVQIGTLSDSRLVEGGGLVIDYRPSSSDSVRRVIIASNDAAMWVEADFPLVQECEGS